MRGFGGIESQSHGLPFGRPHAVDQDAIARLEIRNLIEEHTRAALGMIEHFGDGADIFFGVGACDSFHFTERIHPREPFAQVAPAGLSSGLSWQRFCHLFASSNIRQVTFG